MLTDIGLSGPRHFYSQMLVDPCEYLLRGICERSRVSGDHRSPLVEGQT